MPSPYPTYTQGPQLAPHVPDGVPPAPSSCYGGPSRANHARAAAAHTVLSPRLCVSPAKRRCAEARADECRRAGPGRAVPGQSAVLLAGAQELLQAGPKKHAAKVEQHGPPRHGRPPAAGTRTRTRDPNDPNAAGAEALPSVQAPPPRPRPAPCPGAALGPSAAV